MRRECAVRWLWLENPRWFSSPTVNDGAPNNPGATRLFVLRAQSLLSLRRPGRQERRLCIHTEPAENGTERCLVADVLLFGVVGRKYHPCECRRPAFCFAHKCQPRCFQPVLRKSNWWQRERPPVSLANPLRVAPHIAPLRNRIVIRVAVEHEDARKFLQCWNRFD